MLSTSRVDLRRFVLRRREVSCGIRLESAPAMLVRQRGFLWHATGIRPLSAGVAHQGKLEPGSSAFRARPSHAQLPPKLNRGASKSFAGSTKGARGASIGGGRRRPRPQAFGGGRARPRLPSLARRASTGVGRGSLRLLAAGGRQHAQAGLRAAPDVALGQHPSHGTRGTCWSKSCNLH